MDFIYKASESFEADPISLSNTEPLDSWLCVHLWRHILQTLKKKKSAKRLIKNFTLPPAHN